LEAHLRATEHHLPYGHTVLDAARHRRTRPALTTAR